MKIVLAGGTGFLGGPLTARLAARGHEIVVLSRGGGTRDGAVRTVAWQPDSAAGSATGLGQTWATEVDGADAVVNLAGAGIADERWSARRKDVLRQSRISSTRSLVAAIRRAAGTPPVFLSGSAVGYYGATGDEPLDESFPPGSDFLAKLCVDWEAEAQAALALGCRLAVIRTGVVLARDGGALKKLIPPFLAFAGGPISSGRQFMSWIHREDWIALVVWALEHAEVSGVLNATAPSPVTNRDFSKALGHALHRPSWLTMPALGLRALVGEMADVALVSGQRVVPKRALELGFTFAYPHIDDTLRAAVSSR